MIDIIGLFKIKLMIINYLSINIKFILFYHFIRIFNFKISPMKKYITTILSVFIIIFQFSCTKDDQNTDQLVSQDINLITNNVVPGQIVIAKASIRPSTDTVPILLNGKLIRAGVTDSSEIIFILPVISPGSAIIDFTPMGISKTAQLNVSNYDLIDNPDLLINSFQTQVSQIITFFEEYEQRPIWQMNQSFGDALIYLKDIQTSNLNTLSVTEKTELAYFIRENMPISSDFQMDTADASFYERYTSNENSPSERIWKVSNSVKANNIRSITFLTVGVALLYATTPTFVEKIAAATSLSLGLMYLARAQDGIEEMIRIKGHAVEITDVNRATQIDPIVLVDGRNTEFIIKSSHRTILNTDKSSGNTFFASLFVDKDRVDRGLQQVQNVINKIRFWFGGNPPVTPTSTSPIRTYFFTSDFPLLGQGITIDNVSNNAISISYIKNQKSIDIKAVSSTLTAETPFTIRINYLDPYTKVSISRVIDCIYKKLPPNPLAGTWIATSIDHYGNNLFNWFTTTLGGCSASNQYTTYYKYDSWRVTFNDDGTFINEQIFSPGSYKEYVPNLGAVCVNRNTSYFNTSTFSNTYDIAGFNTNNQINIPINYVSLSVAASIFYTDYFQLTLINPTTMKLFATYNGYDRQYLLVKQ